MEQVKDIPVVERPDYDNAVNFRGIPSNVRPSEQEIRDLKLVEGNPNIHLHPRKDGQIYRGEVRYVDTERGFCIQQSGKHSLFFHELKDLDRTPAKGENIKLAYSRDGRSAVVISQETTQARAHVRA